MPHEQIRNPKSEIRRKSETRNPKPGVDAAGTIGRKTRTTKDAEYVGRRCACLRCWAIPRLTIAARLAPFSRAQRQIRTLAESRIRISDFGLPSDFGIRVSDFPRTLGH